MNYLDRTVMSLQEPEKGPEPKENNSEFILPDNFAGPLFALLLYRILTKNSHFSEERECRMTILDPPDDIEFFIRNGVIVPYTKTPQASESLMDCIEGAIVGPGANQQVHYQGVQQLLKSLDMEIEVRLSKIPYTGS